MSDADYYAYIHSLEEMAASDPAALFARLDAPGGSPGTLANLIDALGHVADSDTAMPRIRAALSHASLVVQEAALNALSNHMAHADGPPLVRSVVADMTRHPVIRQIAQENIEWWLEEEDG